VVIYLAVLVVVLMACAALSATDFRPAASMPARASSGTLPGCKRLHRRVRRALGIGAVIGSIPLLAGWLSPGLCWLWIGGAIWVPPLAVGLALSGRGRAMQDPRPLRPRVHLTRWLVLGAVVSGGASIGYVATSTRYGLVGSMAAAPRASGCGVAVVRLPVGYGVGPLWC
jgi:hypothetical protein